MSTILPTARGKSWVFQVTGLCIVLGALLGLSLKTQKQAAQEGGIPNRMPALRAALGDAKQLNDKLKKDLAYYRTRCEDLSKAAAAGTSGARSLVKTLNEAKMMAGTIAVHGPGIMLTITDSPRLSKLETRPEMIEAFSAHDTDLLPIVNELFASGAEAVAINEERIIGTTAIRCGGPVVLVNYTRLAPPYVIKAIGKPDTLDAGIRMRGGALDVSGLMGLDMVTVKRENDILVPAFTGSTHFTIAKPVMERGRRGG